MEVTPLGHSHIQVSKLCLGAVNFGTKVDKEHSFALLDAYCEAGGRFIDTANCYSTLYGGVGGESETVIGEWMKERGNREDLIIATKVGFNTPDIGPGLSSELIGSEFERSLIRLRTEYVDLYYAHKDQREDPLDETLEKFNRLHRQGKLRAIGCSNYLAWRIEEARQISREHGWPEYCCVQQKHTYLRPAAGTFDVTHPIASDDLMDYCREKRDVVILAYSPTLKGAYTRSDREIGAAYRGADSDARMAALKKVAADTGATPIQVVFAWMLSSDPFVLPLVTAGTIEQMNENLGSLDVTLSAEQMEFLNTAGNP